MLKSSSLQILICVFLSVFLFSCTENLYDEFADKDTQEAIYFQARLEINNRNYAQAITLLESLDADFIGARERIPTFASAYSGLCGLEFLTLLTNLQQGGSGTVLSQLMVGFPGADSDSVTACVTAENIIQTIGDATARDGDENLLMAFNALAKMGTILSSLADTDDDGMADNGGAPANTFDQCDADDLSDTNVREFGASLAIAIQSLTATGTAYIEDTLNEVSSFCTLPGLADVCAKTEPDNFEPVEVQTLRYLIGSNDFGIDSCGSNDFANCAIANPVCP